MSGRSFTANSRKFEFRSGRLPNCSLRIYVNACARAIFTGDCGLPVKHEVE